MTLAPAARAVAAAATPAAATAPRLPAWTRSMAVRSRAGGAGTGSPPVLVTTRTPGSSAASVCAGSPTAST